MNEHRSTVHVLQRSALLDLCHKACSSDYDTALGYSLMLYQSLDYINHCTCTHKLVSKARSHYDQPANTIGFFEVQQSQLTISKAGCRGDPYQDDDHVFLHKHQLIEPLPRYLRSVFIQY